MAMLDLTHHSKSPCRTCLCQASTSFQTKALSCMYEIGRNKHKVTVAYLPNLIHQYDLPQVVDQAPKSGNLACLVGGLVLCHDLPSNLVSENQNDTIKSHTHQQFPHELDATLYTVHPFHLTLAQIRVLISVHFTLGELLSPPPSRPENVCVINHSTPIVSQSHIQQPWPPNDK